MKNLIIILSFLTTLPAFSYDLLNPTPKEKMRPISTDRPNKTESPFTVDAGHFLIESDLINFTTDRDRGNDSRSSTLNILNNNYKIGLTDNVDFQVISGTWMKKRTTGPDSSDQNGYGDTILRLKKNLHGNAGSGDFGLGFLPYVKLPTAGAGMTNGRTEGGLIFPLLINLPEGFGLGLQAQVDHIRRADDRGWQTDYVISTSIDKTLIGELKGFTELWMKSSDNATQRSVATLDLGLIYLATENLQLDVGAFFGLTEASDDLMSFVGISYLH